MILAYESSECTLISLWDRVNIKNISVLILFSVIQRDTNHLQNANVTSINTENEAKMDFSSHTDKTESCSLEEIKTKSQEKQSPISSKGKYDLRPSTLVPRDYGEEEEEESAEKKKVEAVIDLTEDDEVGVEARESKPVETKAGLPSKDDSSMRSWRLCHSLRQISSRTVWHIYSCTYNREQNSILSTPCYFNFISFTLVKLTFPPQKKKQKKQKKHVVSWLHEFLAKCRQLWGGSLV